MLQVKQRTNDGNSNSLKSLLCVASPGAGKTLAQWCVCINWCVYEALTSIDEMVTILMVADDEQVKGQANEVPKLVPLLRKSLTSRNADMDSLLTKAATEKFLDNLPSKKTILVKGNVSREVKGSNVGKTVLPMYPGKYTIDDLGKDELINVPVGGGSLEQEYAKIVNTVEQFYDVDLAPWVTACLANGGSALKKFVPDTNNNGVATIKRIITKLETLKTRLQKVKGKWESAMNINAYIQTIVEVARGSNLGNVKRLEGDDRRKIQMGDLVRFFLADTLRTGKGSRSRTTPYYYVNYWRVDASGYPAEVLVTPLCNSSDDVIANLPQHFGWADFSRLFQLDKYNVYRFQYVPSAKVSIVDRPLGGGGKGGRGLGEEKKLYDLSNDNVRRLLNDKYNVDYKLDGKTDIWWMRYGAFRPSWWEDKTPWPTRTSQEYPKGGSRGVKKKELPSVLIIGMTHSEFNKLSACNSAKAWSSTLIICDEIHQFEQKKAADTLRHAISKGAKSVDFTATPYHDAEDFAVLCGTLGGKKVLKPKTYMKGQAAKYAKQHGVLVYHHDMTSGKFNSMMPSLYPNLANRSLKPGGRINVRSAILNYNRNSAATFTTTRGWAVVDPSLEKAIEKRGKGMKYPFEKVSSKPKRNAIANGTFMSNKNNNNNDNNDNENNNNNDNNGKNNVGYGKYYSNNKNNAYYNNNNNNAYYSNNKNNSNNGKNNGMKGAKAANLLTFPGATKQNKKALQRVYKQIKLQNGFNNNASIKNAQYATLKKLRTGLKKKRESDAKKKAGVNQLAMMMAAMKQLEK